MSSSDPHHHHCSSCRDHDHDTPQSIRDKIVSSITLPRLYIEYATIITVILALSMTVYRTDITQFITDCQTNNILPVSKDHFSFVQSARTAPQSFDEYALSQRNNNNNNNNNNNGMRLQGACSGQCSVCSSTCTRWDADGYDCCGYNSRTGMCSYCKVSASVIGLIVGIIIAIYLGPSIIYGLIILFMRCCYDGNIGSMKSSSHYEAWAVFHGTTLSESSGNNQFNQAAMATVGINGGCGQECLFHCIGLFFCTCCYPFCACCTSSASNQNVAGRIQSGMAAKGLSVQVAFLTSCIPHCCNVMFVGLLKGGVAQTQVIVATVPGYAQAVPMQGAVYAQPVVYAQPQYGQPQYGQPNYAQPQYGQPQPQYGQPQYGQGQPQYNNNNNNNNNAAQPAYGQPAYNPAAGPAPTYSEPPAVEKPLVYA